MWKVLSAVGCGVLVAGCSTASHDASSTPRAQTPSPSVSSSPCSSVTETTPIQNVSPACAALWQPYGVTKVPPSNELSLENVPAGPTVNNRTDGAISNSDAQVWVDASNRESGWFEWSEANGQFPFLAHLSAEGLLNPAERAALDSGATIDQPACNLYPVAAWLFPIDADGRLLRLIAIESQRQVSDRGAIHQALLDSRRNVS